MCGDSDSHNCLCQKYLCMTPSPRLYMDRCIIIHNILVVRGYHQYTCNHVKTKQTISRSFHCLCRELRTENYLFDLIHSYFCYNNTICIIILQFVCVCVSVCSPHAHAQHVTGQLFFEFEVVTPCHSLSALHTLVV